MFEADEVVSISIEKFLAIIATTFFTSFSVFGLALFKAFCIISFVVDVIHGAMPRKHLSYLSKSFGIDNLKTRTVNKSFAKVNIVFRKNLLASLLSPVGSIADAPLLFTDAPAIENGLNEKA